MSCILIKMGWSSLPKNYGFEPENSFLMCVQKKHTLSFSLNCPKYGESSVWRHSYVCLNRPFPRYSLAVKHLFLPKNFSILKPNISCLLITCKGIQKNNHHEKCTFIHDGNWGDSELIEHQNFHHGWDCQRFEELGFQDQLLRGKPAHETQRTVMQAYHLR